MGVTAVTEEGPRSAWRHVAVAERIALQDVGHRGGVETTDRRGITARESHCGIKQLVLLLLELVLLNLELLELLQLLVKDDLLLDLLGQIDD